MISTRRFPQVRFAVLIPGVMLALILLLMFIMHHDYQQNISQQKSTGLGAVATGWDPISLWKQSSPMEYIHPSSRGGVIGGRLESVTYDQQQDKQSIAPDRKLIRTVALELVVRDVRGASEQLRRITENFSGEIDTLGISEQDLSLRSGALKMRVPADQLENALSEFKKIAVRVQREELQARDITREYTDSEARLRNMRAEEQQYLALLRRAGSMKDTLEVTEKINEVRGNIERMQADLNFMAHQVAMSSVDVSLMQESDAQVAGIHWRPLYNAKLSAREMLSGMADWADFLVALLLRIPLILVWLVTIVVIGALAWKSVRWLWRRFFPNANSMKAGPAPESA
jgi:hypothetical protein